MLREIHNRLCLSVLQKQARPPASWELQRSAVVFSPHYDDETLGAGGTIIQKRRSGAPVHIVFMTDGSRSHAKAMDGARLAEIRKAESLKAAAALGVAASAVTFLDFPELRLSHHRREAVERVAALLRRLSCQEVYVPSTLEPLLWSADHHETTDVVFRALASVGQRPQVLEYLVWFWYHWPWVSLSHGGDRRQLLRLTLSNWFGTRGWGRLNIGVPIGDALPQKRAALDEYKSQMTRLIGHKPWPTLADVGGGEFLKRFYHPVEFFRQYTFVPPANGEMS
jgi:LmbE family N-acetylglucosaminyl deacetylase